MKRSDNVSVYTDTDKTVCLFTASVANACAILGCKMEAERRILAELAYGHEYVQLHSNGRPFGPFNFPYLIIARA